MFDMGHFRQISGTSVSDLLIRLAEAEDQERLERFKAAWEAYTNGGDTPLKVDPGDPDDNIVIPYEQVVVNKGRSFLFGEEVTFTVPEAEDEKTARTLTDPKDPALPGASKKPLTLDAVTGDGNPAAKRAAKSSGNQTPPDNAEKVDPAQGDTPADPRDEPEEEVDPLDPAQAPTAPVTPAQKAQDYLDRVWKYNRKMTKLLKLATNGGVFGHVFIKMMVKEDQELPDLAVLDPATVYVSPDPENIDGVPLEYRIVWNTVEDRGAGEPTGVAKRQVITRSKDADTDVDLGTWHIIDQEAQLTNGTGLAWETVEEYDWEYSWPPIIDCQNLPVPNEYWGRSDLEESILKLGGKVNTLLSNLNRIIRIHAHPHLLGVGLDPQQVQDLDFGPDDITPIPPDTDIRAVEIPNDLQSSIEMYVKIKELYHEVTRIPEIATGKVENAGPLSGVALDILYGPLKEVTKDKRQTYGDMLQELCRRILDLGDHGEDWEVEITWPDIIPKDPEAEANRQRFDKELGVSADTLLEMRGYDPELERARREREQAERLSVELRRIEGGIGIGGDEEEEDE